MGPLPSGSGTSRNRPLPETSVSSGRPQSTQRRRRPLEGGNGTGQQCAPPRPVSRVFGPSLSTTRRLPRGNCLGGDYFDAAAVLVVVPLEEEELSDDEEVDDEDEAAGDEVEEDDDEEDEESFLVEL